MYPLSALFLDTIYINLLSEVYCDVYTLHIPHKLKRPNANMYIFISLKIWVIYPGNLSKHNHGILQDNKSSIQDRKHLKHC